MYTCSGQVALKYAGNSCVPLSPAVYRVAAARTLGFREEFGKVCDAVYFCDLTEVGNIAYQTRPLYECRAHPGQDSSHFPYELLNKLEQFFWVRKCADEAETGRLHVLLLKQHTARSLRQMFVALKMGRVLQVVSLFGDPKFKVGFAIQAFLDRFLQSIFRKW